MKTAIIYVSTHHNNTKKIVDAMKEEIKIDIYTVEEAKNKDFSFYDCVGFGSGIYYHKFHDSILKLAEEIELNENQKIFTFYTCGINYINYARGIEKIIKSKKCQYVGCFSCRGYDTFGIFGRIGGIAKNHPNQEDFNKAKNFIKKVQSSK